MRRWRGREEHGCDHDPAIERPGCANGSRRFPMGDEGAYGNQPVPPVSPTQPLYRKARAQGRGDQQQGRD